MANKKLTRRQTKKLLKSAGLNSNTTTQILKPNTASVYVTDYDNGGSKVVKTETSGSSGQIKVTTIKKSSSSSTPQITQQIYQTPQQVPTYLVTSQTAPLVNKSAINLFQRRLLQAKLQRQQRLIRPLRPIKTLKNLGSKLSEKLETTTRNLQTKELRSLEKENKAIKTIGRQTAILGLSFGVEAIRGIKGIAQLPKVIPKLPALGIKLVKNRKNIIPMAKLRLNSFRNRTGQLLRTSPSTFMGKIGANIFLFKATGKGLKIAGKLNKPAFKELTKNLPKITKKSKMIFTSVQIQKGKKIYSFIEFKSGRKIFGYAFGESKIGKAGKLVLNEFKGKAYQKKAFAFLREKPLNTKKAVSFIGSDVGGAVKKNYLKIVKINKGAMFLEKDLQGITGRLKSPILTLKKGVTINKAITNYIQKSVGSSLQVEGKKFFTIVKNKKVIKITSKPLTLRTFIGQARTFTKKDLSFIIGRTKTNLNELIRYKGVVRTIRLKDGVKFIKVGASGGKQIAKLTKQNLVNIASALSVGQVGAKKILSKLSPTAQKIVTNNIKLGLVLIPKINNKGVNLPGVKGVSASSLTTSLTGLETPNKNKDSSSISSSTRQVPVHIDYFQPITGVVSSTATKSVSKSKTIPKQQEKLIEVLSSPTAQREIQKLTPSQISRLKQNLRQYIRFYPKMSVPLVRVIPFSFIVKGKGKTRNNLVTKGQKTGYIVYGLNKKVFVRLNRLPLSKFDALSRGAYTIDRTTARTFKIVPVSSVKKFGHLIKREKGYYTKTKPKFREYKITKGQKKILTYKLIEKRKYGIDTPGEKKGLSLYRYLSKLKKSGKY